MFGLVYSPWEWVTNKSPRVPGLSFPSSYRDSTFLGIFAVPNNAVFWITSNLTFTPIRFTYSLKLTDMAPRAPVTSTTMTFHVRQTFANWSFNSWYFSIFSSSLSFTLSSPGMATSIMTTSHSIILINKDNFWFSDSYYYYYYYYYYHYYYYYYWRCILKFAWFSSSSNWFTPSVKSCFL